MSEPNIPLLRKVVEWAEEQEALTEDRVWWQEEFIVDLSDMSLGDEWSCGTGMCIAGKVALDAGWKPSWNGFTTTGTVMKDGKLRYVTDVACDLLGLEGDHQGLFWGDNIATDIRRIAEDIAGERL